MVGQHVTIEADLGIDETPKEGVWVDDYYICDADRSPYVWAEGGDGKLAKRTVVLGEYDKDSMKYEITSGLTLEDKIAMPEERLFEGMKVTYNQDDPALNIDMGSNEMTIPIEDMGEISDLTEVGETEASQVSEAG